MTAKCIGRIGALLLIFFLSPLSLYPDQRFIEEPPLMPLSPIIMAPGGSYLVVANGYNAFFSNPAGFAGGQAFFTRELGESFGDLPSSGVTVEFVLRF